ncbi:acyltransferase [uncultured Methanomethylovorans sp.]|uniref:acyltransferase n=1 Tax=uncultured Methanomethylovorans sp. TaxID=183759 RepID=UPI002AA6745E|nr:acyltransferase [uncultured Methanomethylovorans sp.]
MFRKKMMLEKNVFIGRNVLIDPGYSSLISIGNNSVISYGTIILAHDGSLRKYTGYTKIGKVSIGSDTFIGAGSVIMPDVSIGNNVIIGSGSVVTKNIPDNSVAVGNPAVVVDSVSRLVNKHIVNMNNYPVYEKMTKQDARIMEDEWKEGHAYIRTYFETPLSSVKEVNEITNKMM